MEEHSHFSIRAIVIGWVTDQAVTFVSTFIIGFVASLILILADVIHGGNLNQISSEQFQQQFSSSPILLIIVGFVGLLSTMVGGFIRLKTKSIILK